MIKVLGYGDNVFDDYFQQKVMYPGGNALNFSVYTHELGANSAYLGNIAYDELGAYIISVCKQMNIDISKCNLVSNHSTQICRILLNGNAYDDSQEKYDEHYEQFYNELKRYDNLFDIYKHYDGITNLYDVNKSAAVSPVKVDSEITELLKFGKKAYELTDGKTNICFGSVLKLWHDEREWATENPDDAKLPDDGALKEASKHTNIDDLIIDEENSTVYFKDKDLQLDVGAIAKGYAVSKVAQWAQENLWSSAAISIGGNVATFGYKNNDGSTLWKIGIENPDKTAEDYLMTVNITGLSVVTSGNYQRYYTVNNKQYCHIINPDTLMPAEFMTSVSVICEDSALGDALSTGLFNMSIEDGKNLVDSMDGVEAVWVDNNYNKTYSNGFEKYINKNQE